MGWLIPPPATRKYQAPNAVPQKSTLISSSRRNGHGGASLSFGGLIHVSRNGVNTSTDIALLDHHRNNESKKSSPDPVAVNAAAPINAARNALMIPPQVIKPRNSVRVRSVGVSATNRRTSHAPVKARTRFAT